MCGRFKSYTDLFYSRTTPSENPHNHDINWLLHGPIDKPAYFVARATQSQPYDDPSLGLVKIGRSTGSCITGGTCGEIIRK